MATHTIELTDEELRLLHAALHSYLDDFGHDEADVLRRIKALIAKLPPQSAIPAAGELARLAEVERGDHAGRARVACVPEEGRDPEQLLGRLQQRVVSRTTSPTRCPPAWTG